MISANFYLLNFLGSSCQRQKKKDNYQEIK